MKSVWLQPSDTSHLPRVKVPGGFRICRFKVGDRVRFSRLSEGLLEKIDGEFTIVSVKTDPLPPFGGGLGAHASYRLDGVAGPVWDWMLDPAETQ